MKVTVYKPQLALQEFVLNISTVHALLPEGVEEAVTPYPPTPFQSLLFYCNDPISMKGSEQSSFSKQPEAVLLGPQYSRVCIKVHKQLKAIRVDFFPGAMFRLLGIHMAELFDKGYNAQDFFGKELRELKEQLQSVFSLEFGKSLVEAFLLKKVTQLKAQLPLDVSLKLLLNSHGNQSMDQTAFQACLSLKQFERKCKERLGMTPKTYARILRFSKAYRLYESCPHYTWTQIAYEAGYYDQMHLIRDFKEFAGVNPSVLEKQLYSTPIHMQKDLPS